MIICYGAPSTGKSYTLFGKEELLRRGTVTLTNSHDSSYWIRDEQSNSPREQAKNSEKGLLAYYSVYLLKGKGL
jgi:hypothetical protein